MWSITSPDERVQVNISQTESGGLIYGLTRSGKAIIKSSALGFKSNLADFTKELIFVSAKQNRIDDDYTIPARKKAVYVNQANELALKFSCSAYIFTLWIRVYDDGMGFRYEVTADTEKEIAVLCEDTGFALAESYNDLWLQHWVCHYEATYNHSGWEDTFDRDYGMPCLFHDKEDGDWVLITEANVYNTNGSYCSCHLRGGHGHNMRIDFAPEEKGMPLPCKLPFQSPWRVVVTASDLTELVNTTLNYNLNPPTEMKDISWIKPGRCLWAWWEFENGAQLYTEQKRYVDFAAAMGFEGLTVDADWDITWLPELCNYAHSKNLVIWLWSAMQYIDTPEKAQAKIPLWAECGVDGLKVDFFQNDSKHTMWQYEMIANLMTEYQLMINFHGATKCMGEGRSWPNFMTAEGIMGLEHYKWSDMPNAQHNCTVPFTRNVVGPMDYTPTGFSNKNRNTTLAHQMALPLVFESGATHIAASIYYLEAWKGTEFLRRLKPVYDGIKVLSGFPGHHAAIMRWTTGEYHIGCITNKAMTMRLPLDFLPEGIFEADIYQDDSSGEMMRVKRRQVGKNDILELPLLAGGGAGIYIAASIGELPQGICSGYMSPSAKEYLAIDGEISAGSEPAEYENGLKTILLNGRLTLDVTANKNGPHTIRIFYAALASFTLQVRQGSNLVAKQLPRSISNKIFVVSDITVNLVKGVNILEFTLLDGVAPSIEKIAILDWAPAPEIFISVHEGQLFGGAELVQGKDGVTKAVGLGLGGEIIFDQIVLPEEDYYIVRLDYCAGESRDLDIEVNDSEIYKTNLHSTSGWGFPVWDVREGTEIRLKMQKGRNKLRLYHENGRANHLFGLSFMQDL